MDMKDKAKDALPSDDTVEKASEKVQDATPIEADKHVAKAEQWAKDHNED
ncbi:hypothetical protein [uncultured Demequina sp.]|nr:hypothetical protein [uncultured Demequina sp.]